MSAAEWARTSWRHARRAGVVAIGVLAAAVVMSLSVDVAELVPAITLGRVDLRRSAEAWAGRQVDRPVRIGGLSLRVFDGRFIVSDLSIGGPTPAHAPFFKAREILVHVPLWSLLRKQLNIVSVEMTDWRMTVEYFGNGRHSFPKFRRREPGGGPSPIKVSVAYVRTRRGEFAFQDHSTPWGTVVRNLDITVLKLVGYRGYSTSSGGTVTVQSYTPMTAALRTWFRIDGARVLLDRIELDTDGAASTLTGAVDIANWPEQTYDIDSVIDLATQRGIWWAPYNFTLSGEAVFKGRFHYFKGGRELTGRFRSEEAGLDWYRFPQLEGHVRWTPDRVEVTDARSKLYGGDAQFTYTMSMFGRDIPTAARFEATYDSVDLRAFTDAMEMKGLRLAGSISGHNLLEWRLGHWDEHHGHGSLTATPPPGVVLQGRALAPEGRPPSFAHVFGDPFPPLGAVPIGGSLHYQYGPEWVDVAPSLVATETTCVEFQGRTAYGERSVIPFHVTSAEWQESDRLLAGIITAFGSPTRAVEMGGAGTFDGVLLNAFRAPRIEGVFAAARMRAWDVEWGRGESRIVVENGYVDVTDAVARKGNGTLRANGRFSLGYPRKDGGEEINAVVTIDGWNLKDLRHAFILDEYPYDGDLSGEFHLYDKYLEPYGFGRVTVAPAVAYGETVTSASASLRFVGPGLWLDAIEIRKGTTGVVRGAAHVEWEGFYSFNVDARQIPIESIDMLAFPEAPLTGTLDFTSSGSGAFLEPTYDVDFQVRDLFVRDEGIGDLRKGRLELRNDDLNFSFVVGSARFPATAVGKVTLLGDYPGDVNIRVTDASLDPYARVFVPSLSPFAQAVASGTLRLSGALASLDNLVARLHVDTLDLKLFDYRLHNDGPIDVTLEQGLARVGRFRLAGEDTQLSVSGNVDVVQGVLGLRAEGAANLGILQAFLKDIRGSGRAQVTADFTGTMEKPQLRGSAVIDGGRLRHMWLPHAIDAIDGRVTFTGSSVRFDDVAATIGRGAARFGGRIGLTGLWPSLLDLTFTGENMELRYPTGFRSVVDADLGLRGSLDNPTLSGTVLVKRSELRRTVDLGADLVELAGSAGAGAPAAPAPAASFPLRFDLRLTAPSTLEIDNKLARLTASADLRLRGTYDRPVLEGRAEVDRGEVWFEGRRYLVSRGTVDFTNPSKIEPFFDVEAETRVRAPGQTYQVTLRASGTTAKLEWELSSDPPLPEVEVLSLLLGDVRSTEDAELRALRTPDSAEQNLLVSRSARLLASPISSNVQKVVEQTFGLDSVQISPFFVDPSQQTARFSPGARITIGKRISDRIYLTYSRSLTSAAQDQVILLEYDQNERLSWILTQNEDRTYALDVRVRYVFK
ncbi:MAG: translocation/assembly module TamB domain-containing protein [Vicinamibacterales bacterium]